MIDHPPVLCKFEVPGVFVVVAAQAEPVLVRLLGGQGDQLAELGIVGLFFVF
jgi:hypothetical protein